jgi:hypothetical protein
MRPAAAMSELSFARYAPRPSGARPAGAQADVREATAADVDACVALATGQGGGTPADHRRRLERCLADPRGCVFVATIAGDPAGHGRVVWLDPAADLPRAGDETAVPHPVPPAGLYLVGLVVAADRRRLGVGRAITVARTAWALEREPEVWYFANALTFAGGVGVLCRATRRT